ncbi:MAG: RdgB/HAM1 family non-canonical purine NTP pyrophosphatase [Chloroflexota bacterium]|nr:RdgB/HAM1 family non-canonical purine NTP pyrophosphatase [Chloroflexota bacterium]MDE3193408.1 RdgB/HAM1 family non-canonical purine NTP pyrophosphatase [Chloroflexota bacterium]
MRTLLIGSGNAGKVKEYRRMLTGLDLRLVSPEQLDPLPPEPDEDHDTYARNARDKAETYAAATGLATVADDSGLEVDALGGAPGVRSRRYFGERTTPEERNARLLALLEEAPQRDARFVCVVALATPGEPTRLFEGVVRGEIATAPRRGERGWGFGYDPVFIVGGDGRTMAELPPEEKDAISHRGLAVAKLRSFLSGEPR